MFEINFIERGNECVDGFLLMCIRDYFFLGVYGGWNDFIE